MKHIVHYFLGIIISGLIASHSMAETPKGAVGFHFYGADNCPPCQRFKNNHLADVKRLGEQKGFTVHANMVPKISDVSKTGIYGESDTLLREAAKNLRFTYPPIFIVTYNGQVKKAYLQDWRSALHDVKALIES